MCPFTMTKYRPPKRFLVKDGRIFFDGAWRYIPSVIKKRIERRERALKRYATDPEYRKKCSERKKVCYEKNKQLNKKRSRERWAAVPTEKRAELLRKRKERKKNDPENNAKQREWYRRKREIRLIKILSARDRKDPSRELNRALALFRRNEISLNELNRRCANAVKLANATANGSPRDAGIKSGHRKPR